MSLENNHNNYKSNEQNQQRCIYHHKYVLYLGHHIYQGGQSFHIEENWMPTIEPCYLYHKQTLNYCVVMLMVLAKPHAYTMNYLTSSPSILTILRSLVCENFLDTVHVCLISYLNLISIYHYINLFLKWFPLIITINQGDDYQVCYHSNNLIKIQNLSLKILGYSIIYQNICQTVSLYLFQTKHFLFI